MCGPTLLLIGTLAQGVGSMMQLSAQAQNAEMQAELLDKQAQEERLTGAYKAGRLGDQAARIGGQQRTAAAEGGLDPTGSVVDVAASSAEEVELDMQAIMFNSRSAADNKWFAAGIQRQNARSARASMPFAFLSPILNNASKFPDVFGVA